MAEAVFALARRVGRGTGGEGGAAEVDAWSGLTAATLCRFERRGGDAGSDSEEA